jgi:hypothetical protein
MITKKTLVEILWGLARDDEKYIKIRSDRTLNGDPLWHRGEWIYVKEIERLLKQIYREVKAGSLEFDGDIVNSIVSNKIDIQLQSNKFLLQKIKDCQDNLEMLSNESV